MSTSRVAVTTLALLAGLGASVAAAQQPVTLTSTADFDRGNNEGLITTADGRVTRDRISAGTVGAWSQTTPLPSARTGVASVAYNGFLYVIGGEQPNPNMTMRREVLVAPILDPSGLPVPVQMPIGGGSIGPWTATTELPSGRAYSEAVAYNGFLYVIGGYAGDYISGVLVAPIHGDGTVGAWSATTGLPLRGSILGAGRFNHTAVAHNGFLYVTGGESSILSGNQHLEESRRNDVEVAPIHADGTLGAWSATTALPVPLRGHRTVAYNGFLYLVGGDDPNPGVLADVWVAPIGPDGALGAWSSATGLPFARSFHGSVAWNGFIYSIGGSSSVGQLSAVLAAPLNADGSVGAWSATSALPVPRGFPTCSVYKGFVYMIAGEDSDGLQADIVMVTAIDADSGDGNQAPNRLRGVFSRLVDLQGDTSTRFIRVNGQLSSGGAVRLQVRVAPADTKVFGAETVVNSVTMGSAIEVSGTGRYVWIRLTLDDTGAGNVDQPTYVSDITISPTASNGLFLSPGPVIAPDATPGEKSSCAFGASAGAGSGLALLGGLALLASALRRKRSHDQV